MDRKVKRLLVFYITSALCCTLVFCGGILADKYASSLLTSYDLFQTIKVKKVNMKEAIKNIDVAIAQALRFPFFVISTMSIDKLEREQKEIVIFEIKGALTMRTNFPEYTSGS
jgi:hypothetical protein